VEPNPEYVRRLNEYLETQPGHTRGDPSNSAGASAGVTSPAGGFQLTYQHNGATHSMNVNPTEGAGARCGARSEGAIDNASAWFSECIRGIENFCRVPGQ
jgi:hypothetical protein